MLQRIDIKNLAIIHQAQFEPGTGFSIITGETGAGKSLLIDALLLIRGARSYKDSVRSGAESASIDAIFDQISNVFSKSEIEDFPFPFDLEEDTLILSREVSADGRSTARINGRLVTLSILREIGERLVDIHGQNEQQSIFLPERHITFLDRYAGDSVSKALEEYKESLNKYRSCVEEIRTLGADPAERERRSEVLLYQIHELESARFVVGEEEQLIEKKRFLQQEKKIREGITECLLSLRSERYDALKSLSDAHGSLSAVARIDDSWQSLANELESATLSVSGVLSEIEKRMEEETEDAARLEEVVDRLDLLYRFQSKYGPDIAAFYRYLYDARTEYETIKGSAKRLEVLHRQRQEFEKELMNRADLLHSLREKAARFLSEEIGRELSDLGMPGAVFAVTFSKRPKERFFSRTGYDNIEFALSANPGEPLKPLAKTASGGEASRIMLAIKTILASADDIPTLVFDEIDTGISGKTATVVAQKIQILSKTHQVLLVSHMAQIAAAADRHFRIEKKNDGEKTFTSIQILDRAGREEEISRLLSGDTEDSVSLDLASKMLDRPGVTIL